mmetsp:Transcript_73478/g.159070  ORF Transcript_73478/g.159070 Transcript_73478/m.159070 type:complete len:96 (+) Transcript_73478:1082-1369(+)
MAKLPVGTINMEYSVNEDQILDAIADVIEVMNTFRETSGLVRKKPIIVRPVGKDRMGYLSPTLNRMTYFIDIPYDKSDANETEMFKILENMFLEK